jgi:hypothetical protein
MFTMPQITCHKKRDYTKRSAKDVEFMIDSLTKQKFEICNEIDRKILDLRKSLIRMKEHNNE